MTEGIPAPSDLGMHKRCRRQGSRKGIFLRDVKITMTWKVSSTVRLLVCLWDTGVLSYKPEARFS